MNKIFVIVICLCAFITNLAKATCTAISNSALAGIYTDTVQVKLAYPPYGASDQQVANLTLAYAFEALAALTTVALTALAIGPLALTYPT